MKLNSSIVINKNFDGTCVICNAATSKAMLVNHTGAAIIQFIENGLDEAEIIEKLSSAFKVTKDRAERDVSEFLTLLRSKNLLSQD